MTNADYIPDETTDTTPNITDFLEVVFPELPPEEERLFWACKSATPGFPSDYSSFNNTISRGGKRACYYATATMRRDSDNKLFNRQNLFGALYVIVLDDIGTGLGAKVTEDAIPRALLDRVTYKVESSPDNYQYGFVLENGVTNLDAAKSLVRLVVGASGADTGGCMPNKLVRLPCGVNLKDKYGGEDGDLFQCHLVELDGDNLWTPDELLDASGAGVTWEQVLSGEGERQQRQPRIGTTAYRTDAYSPNMDGIDDPVVKWLNDRGMLMSESNTWISIKCPWANDHTSGDGSAGYKALGAGDMQDRRAFHCFHEHCSGHKTGEFLDWVAANGGPLAAVVDPVGELVAKYSLDMATNEVINMKSGNFDRLPVGGFKNGHMRDVWLSTGDGKMTKASEYGLFIKDLNLLRLSGVRRVPGGDRLLSDGIDGGDILLNGWSLPDWGRGGWRREVVDVFVDFIEYLLPEDGDASWFLDHLACKAQNPQYRGAGIIMTTPVQGTGRGTMEAIIRQLWGAWNVRTLRFGELIKGLSGDGFNDWIRGDWLVVPEAKEATMNGRTESRAYESLKSFVEPGGVSLRINRKNVPEWYEDCYGSVIICSQHANVLNMESGDTRFKRMLNTIEPRDYDYFVSLREWMGSGFEADLWRWLCDRDVSDFKPYARRAVMSDSAVIENALDTGSAIDAAIALVLGYSDKHVGGMVFINDMSDYLEGLSYDLGLERIEGWKRIVRRELKNQTRSINMNSGELWRFRIDGDRYRPRATVRQGVHAAKAVVNEDKDFIEGLKKAAKAASSEEFIKYCRGLMG